MECKLNLERVIGKGWLKLQLPRLKNSALKKAANKAAFFPALA